MFGRDERRMDRATAQRCADVAELLGAPVVAAAIRAEMLLDGPAPSYLQTDAVLEMAARLEALGFAPEGRSCALPVMVARAGAEVERLRTRVTELERAVPPAKTPRRSRDEILAALRLDVEDWVLNARIGSTPDMEASRL